jgi:hypothetical protein
LAALFVLPSFARLINGLREYREPASVAAGKIVSCPGAKAGKAPRRNDNDVEVGPWRGTFVSLSAWLIDYFCCCAAVSAALNRVA